MNKILFVIMIFLSTNALAINIASSDFPNGGNISNEYTCVGLDVSPPLVWSNIPAGAKSLAIILDDPDAPSGIFTHWILFNIPPDRKTLGRNLAKAANLPDGLLQGTNDFGKVGYNGPCPPVGKVHRYFFHVYALDKIIDLNSKVNRQGFNQVIGDHIVGEGSVMGFFGR